MIYRATLRLAPILVIGVAIGAVSGCGLLRVNPAPDYETIKADPVHDQRTARTANDQALRAWAEGNLDEAESQFKKALAADVTYGPAHNNLGSLYYHGGRLYLAAWEFEYTAKLMSDRPEPHNNLGLVLESVGRLDEAIAAYESAVGLDSKNPHFVGNLARACYYRNKEDPVVRVLLERLLLIETRPDWLHWARQTLAIESPSCHVEGDVPFSAGASAPPGTAEVISTPIPEEVPFPGETTFDHPDDTTP
ncbi:MAG TPA: hypothetical protein DD670_07835 [Planctomycetaceae bacterium]|nr:hypothetical protein [Planctomycetaceae bacterium]